MKKLMALCLSVLMVLSMCSFTVVAEGTVSFEDFSNGQLQDFIVDDLTFPEGAEVISSNEDVISENGAVTRPLFEDAKVSLTVSGTAFDVVVKAMTVNPVYYADFAEGTPNDYKWVPSGHGKSTMIIENGELSATMTASGTSKRSYLEYNFSDAPLADVVNVALDINDIKNISGEALVDADGNPIYKADGTTQQTTSSGIELRFSAIRYDENGEKLDEISEQALFRISSANITAIGYSSGISFEGTDMEISFDGNTGIVSISDGNGTFYESKTNIFTVKSQASADISKIKSVKLSGLGFKSAGDYYVGDFDIDNFVISQNADTSLLLQNASPQQKLNYFAKYLEKDYVADGGSLENLTNDLNFTVPSEVTENGGNIEWSVADNSVITGDGSIIASVADSKSTTVTGTLTVSSDEAPLTKTVTYNVTVAPANIAGCTEIIDGATLSGWTPATVVNPDIESISVQTDSDENNYLKFAVETYNKISPSTTSTSNPSYSWESLDLKNYEELEFNFKLRIPEQVGGVGNFTLFLNEKEESKFIHNGSYLYDQDYSLNANGAVDEWYAADSTARADFLFTKNSWIPMQIIINKDGNAVYKINGNIVGEHMIRSQAEITSVSSAKFLMRTRGSYSTGTGKIQEYNIDDIQLIARYSADDALANANNVTKFEIMKSFLEPESFAKNQNISAITADLNLIPSAVTENGATISWTSSAPSVISENGKITRDSTLPKSATITGTLSMDGFEPVSKTYSVKVAPIGTEMFVGSTYKENFTWNFEDGIDGASITSGGTYDSSGDQRGITNNGSLTYKKTADHGMVIEQSGDGTVTFYSGARSGNYSSRYLIGFDYKFNTSDTSASNNVSVTIAGNSGGNAVASIGIDSSNNHYITVSAAQNAIVNSVNSNSTTNEELWSDKISGLENIHNENVWHSLDIDFNTKGNVYLIYVDGVLVSKIPSSTKQTANSPVISVKVTTKGNDTLQIDNQYMLAYGDTDLICADAALKSAIWEAASRETGQNSRPGPYRKIHYAERDSVIVESVATPSSMYDAALTWKVNGAAHTAETYALPSNAKEVTFEVTATKGDASVTETFTSRFAPIEITNYVTDSSSKTLSSVTFEGDCIGKKLLVSTSDYSTGKICDVKIIDITAQTLDVTDTISTDGNILSFYIIDSTKLIPLAFKR